jgi:OmpA-OmpF porin, OOP family
MESVANIRNTIRTSRGLAMFRFAHSVLAASALAPLLALAAADIPNAQDHPLLARLANSYIAEYERSQTKVEMAYATKRDGEPAWLGVEGDATVIRYVHDGAGAPPNPLQVMRNYQNAIKRLGGKVVYERLPSSTDVGETTLKVRRNGKDVWVRLEPALTDTPLQGYTLAVVEVNAPR